MVKGRLEGLDLLRGIAALMVVFLHLTLTHPMPDWPFAKSYLAVDFFFMLSGFVLTRTYHRRFVEGLGAATFLAKRVRRLWPVAAIGSVIGLMTQLGGRPVGEEALLLAMALSFTPYLASNAVFPLNGVIWSIFFELFANLAHAGVLARISRPLLLAVVVTMTMTMTMALAGAHVGSFDVGSFKHTFVFGFARVILSYTMGCWLYLELGDQPRAGIPGWLAPIALPAILLLGWALGPTGWRFDLLVVVFAFPLILVAGLGELGRGRALGAFAGQLSFPLYAVHVPLIYAVAAAGWHWLTAPPVAIAAAWLIALATGGVTAPNLSFARDTRTKAA